MIIVRHPIVRLCRSNRYAKIGVAIGLATAAYLLTLLMPFRDPAYYSFFLAAVAACGILAGWKSALGCAALSGFISDLLLIQPRWSFWLNDPQDQSRFLGFCGAALLICLMSALLDTSEHALSKAAKKAQQAEDELVRHSNERELLEQSAKFWLFEIDLERDHVRWTDVYNGIRVARIQPFQSWLDQVHVDDRQRVKTAIQDALISGEFESKFRFFVRMGETSPRSVLARARVVVRDEKSIILRGINVDLSVAESPDAVEPSASLKAGA
jgi:hypothetical protein